MTALFITGGLLLIGLMLFYSLRGYAKTRRKQRKHRQMARAYEKQVLKNRVIVDHAEIIDDKVIALDRINKLLLVVNHAGRTKQEYCISLLSITSSKVEKHLSEDGSICKITLHLYVPDRMYSIDFFDQARDHFSELTALNRKALNWKQRVDVHRHPGRIRPEHEYVL